MTAIFLNCAKALTTEEANAFYNSEMTLSGTTYIFTGTGIPDHQTDSFPNRDNPNSISAQDYSYTIMATPEPLEGGTGCLPMGIIGFTVNGVAIFNPYTAFGNNAVEGDYAEVFDMCNGHPNDRGSYHYHNRSSCVADTVFDNNQAEVMYGVALDGYPIYTTSSGDASGLDECHGKTVDGSYRYYATNDFPYFVGCYRGTVIDGQVTSGVGLRSCYYTGETLPEGFEDIVSGIINVASAAAGVHVSMVTGFTCVAAAFSLVKLLQQ